MKNYFKLYEEYTRPRQFLFDVDIKDNPGQDKIEVAINCMHHKAFDYVVKSETAFVRLQKNISTIYEYQKMKKELSWYMDRM